MSPLSPLNFPKAQPPLHLSASQEKPLQPNENIGLVFPEVQYMLVDVDPTGSQSRLDLLNSSTCSEIPSWNKPIYKVTGGVDDKYPTSGKDFSKSAFITLNHMEKNSSTLERLDEKYPFLYQGGKINEERPTSRPEDPLGLFSGSSDFIDSHRGMSHAFSDSKLNENGGSSSYCSQEGMSPLSPLNFPKAQPPLCLSASQESLRRCASCILSH
ncbi:hypothetical protein CMV_003632 [Castanea mollissima]|uniref:Uncharacterized protein n=1 Tax=Castanea mollissima TaxID=60419 RepID=A0A8J4RNL7_9ROSI|nr:hypothetical protein CMV_003632 [Castanea mollissima]